MSQLLRLFGLLTLVFCLLGCGGNGNEDGNEDGNEESGNEDASSNESSSKPGMPTKLLGKIDSTGSSGNPILRAKRVGDQMLLKNNLKQILLAMHQYQDQHRSLPPGGEGKLSWRVRILPMLGYDNLYRQFKLDEPWNSEHNKQLISQMPAIYKSTSADALTSIMVFVGEGALYEGSQPPSIRGITDGTVHTIAVVVAGADKAVPWTKPVDVRFNPSDPYSELGDIGNVLVYATADGAVFSRGKSSVPAGTLKALITKSGGESINLR